MSDTNSTFQIDRIIGRIAAAQLGLITVTQAAAGGVNKWALERRREAGLLAPVLADVMRLTALPATQEQRILAAGLAVPGAAIAGPSAAFVHQLPVRRRAAPPVVSVAASRSARTAGVATVRQTIEFPSQPWHTGRVATPAATLLLLPRFVDSSVLERCLDHCLAHRLTTVAEVRRLIDKVPPRAVVGRPLLLDMLAQRPTGIGHRSGMEQHVARWLHDAGLRGWRRNYRADVGLGRTVEVDFAWPEARAALEVSPFFTHGSKATQERDAERRRLLVVAGWRMVEATDSDLDCQQAFASTTASLRTLLSGDSRASRALGSAGRSETRTTRRRKAG